MSRRIPYGHRFGADLGAGTNFYGKGHAYYGYGTDHWGVLVEGVRLTSDGFKRLDGGGNTGFDRMEFMVKGRVNTDPIADVYNEGRIKLGYGREVSNETYLGLSDADFRQNPVRRYATSALDQFQWDRFLIEVGHSLVVRDVVEVSTTFYRHDFSRDWFRLNRFAAGPAPFEVLLDPTGEAAAFFDVLQGAADTATLGQAIGIGSNDRTFVSQGLQTTSRWEIPDFGPVEQRLSVGLRLHNDRIER
ncbi:MAG: ligand-gated channel protein, partial [Myxococcota bacterium]